MQDKFPDGQVSLSRVARVRRFWPAAAGAVVLALAVVAILEWRESAVQTEKNRLALVPHQFAVQKILYAKEDCSGMGLSGGDNCTGVFIYELPQATAREIRHHGLQYLRSLGPAVAVEQWGVLEEWQSTPVAPNREWMGEERTPLPPPTLAGFLNRYGFSIDVDAKMASDMDASITSPGSFFARDRFGVLLVMPANNRIAYAYRS